MPSLSSTGCLVRLQKGEDAKQAAIDVVKQTAIPLLGATVIAILAFAAIGTSQDNTGEFCRSLFQVVMVSLLLSWVTAVSVTPLLCVMFLKPVLPLERRRPIPMAVEFYVAYKALTASARFVKRSISLALVGGIFVSALWGFGFVEQSFFPPSDAATIYDRPVATAGHTYR